MAEFKRISLLILILAVAFCSAVLQRVNLPGKRIQHLKQRPVVFEKRVLARQEAVTPYPTADELKPEIPFEEGNVPDVVYGAPDETYGPPDETYGPPEIDQTPADQLPAEEAPEEFAHNPDAEEFQIAKENVMFPLKASVSRLTKERKSSKKHLSARLLAKKRQRLTAGPARATVSSSSTLPLTMHFRSYAAPSQQNLFSNQPFAYTAKYQAW